MGVLQVAHLTEPAEALAAYRQRLLAAIGPNGQVLEGALPELTFLLGPPPPAPALDPAASEEDCLRLTAQVFIQALGARERPLVLLLDDLQWADAASLDVVRALLDDPGCAHLLVVGAYSDGELHDGHPLARWLADLIITGISPEAAQALVGLGLDLSKVVTRGTLQSGLAHALELMGGDARSLKRRKAR